jgi:hypothetical protein
VCDLRQPFNRFFKIAHSGCNREADMAFTAGSEADTRCSGNSGFFQQRIG